MKNILIYFLFLAITLSCSSNDFSDTEMYFETDKESYRVDDNFELTVFISTKNRKKKIRFFKNLNNLMISFNSENDDLGFSKLINEKFIEGPSLTGDESEYIDEFTISKTQPFIRSFKGTISEHNEKIIIEIPELNIIDSLDKSELLLNPAIVINGNCTSVYNGLEENFNPKEIKIMF